MDCIFITCTINLRLGVFFEETGEAQEPLLKFNKQQPSQLYRSSKHEKKAGRKQYIQQGEVQETKKETKKIKAIIQPALAMN
jgi:hypothetical protein